MVSASGPSGIGRPQPGELARVGRPAVALPGDERLLDEVDVLERPDLPAHPEAGGFGRRVALGRGALGDTDDHAVHVLERGEAAVGRHHHALTVVERRLEERRPLRTVTGRGEGRVAHERVDLAGLEGGEPVVGGDVDHLDRGRVAEHGGRDHPAEVGVEADVLAARIERGEPRKVVARPAVERARGLDGVERRSGRLHLLHGVARRGAAGGRLAAGGVDGTGRCVGGRRAAAGGVAGGIVVARAARGEHEDRYEW